MTGTIYFIMNPYTVWTLENANFNEINKILLFEKWCITFSLIEKIIYFLYILHGKINIRKLTEFVNSN